MLVALYGQLQLVLTKTKQIENGDRLLVQDNPKLVPDDGGEIPKSQGRGWRFDSWLWNLLSTWHKNLLDGQLPPRLWRWPIGLLSQKKKEKKKKTVTGSATVSVIIPHRFWQVAWVGERCESVECDSTDYEEAVCGVHGAAGARFCEGDCGLPGSHECQRAR